ncbi:MAG: YrhB domain-containing protein [Myxococcota bacterium]
MQPIETEQQACARALEHASAQGSQTLVVTGADAYPWGWLVRLVTEAYHRTRDPMKNPPGLGPVAVTRTGLVESLPTNMPLERRIAQFEKQLRESSS